MEAYGPPRTLSGQPDLPVLASDSAREGEPPHQVRTHVQPRREQANGPLVDNDSALARAPNGGNSHSR